ncbi:hypothetical protein KI387_002349 [Taxus chinensis]|uniref:PB1 domain-containing protein n=1 Tax=Taxus chinensis TaxID=29808 RepID=A0AA38GVY1_TAXCH|nr:hypothetical protein KI387_002349 [Taxus chinensis]
MELHGNGITSPKSSEELGGNKFKFLCSYAGKILPRPGDGNLRYIGGETRVVAVRKNAIFQDIMNKLENLFGPSLILKYQLPIQDLDVLVSVTCDEDLQNMKEEYDRYESFCCKESCPLLRVFLFPAKQIVADSTAENQTLEQRYIDAVNGLLVPSKRLQPKFCDYSFSADPNRPTEMDVDCSAPSTARSNSGSAQTFQTDHPHHLAQALQEVDLNKPHTNHCTCKCKSTTKDRTGVFTQSKSMSHYITVDQSGSRKVPSETMIVVSNPSSPPSPSSVIVDLPPVQLQRVQSSPNLLQQCQGIPASAYFPVRPVAPRPAVTYRGRGGELPTGSRLRYNRSDNHINRPPHQFAYADHPFHQDKVMKMAQGVVSVTQESPINAGNQKHMIRNNSFKILRV